MYDQKLKAIIQKNPNILNIDAAGGAVEFLEE
jgi:hypothetical protein